LLVAYLRFINHYLMKPIKVAIVESDKATRMMLTGMLPTLSRGTIQILMEATTGAELLYKLSGQLPDIVVMDMFTPVMEGIETSGYVRALFPEITLVAMASGVDDFDPALMEILGIQSVLLRDQPLEFMVAALHSIATGSVVMPKNKATSPPKYSAPVPVAKAGFLLPYRVYAPDKDRVRSGELV